MGNVNDTLKKIGVPAEISVPGGIAGVVRHDPYETAIEDRRMQQAMRVYEGMDAEAEARRAEAQTTKLQAELTALETRTRMVQIQQDLGKEGDKGGMMEVIAELMKLMQSDKAELAAQNKDLMAKVLTIQEEAAASIRQQIGQASAQRGTAGQDSMAALAEQIAGLQSVVAAMRSFMPSDGTSAAMRNAEDELRLLKAQKEMEFTTMKMREDHEARMIELRLREEDQRHRHTLDRDRFDVDKRRMDGVASTLERFAPHAMAALGDVVKSRLAGGGQVVSGMVASDGTETIACPSGCGGSIEVKPGQQTVVCPTCKGLFGAVQTPDGQTS